MAMLQASYGYDFMTPVGAANIVNVIGSSANSAFNYAGFFFDCTQVSMSSSCAGGSNNSTPADAAHTLWNFNEQTNLVLTGAVHGSVLAPSANVTLGNGDIVGTFVAKSATSSSEFYSNHGFLDNNPPVTHENPSTAPEPATIVLVATGLVACMGASRRRNRR